jgi:hypothetical protein
MKPLKIRIKKEYLTSVVDVKPITIEWGDGRTINGTAQGSIDHPKFTELRQKLGRDGYIEIQPNWWNGDTTLKKFTLNGMAFNVGDQFPCASAMGTRLSVRNKNK